MDHEVSRTRQAAAGDGAAARDRAAGLSDALAVETMSALRSAARAGRERRRRETSPDAEFSLIRQHRADASLGWLTAGPSPCPPRLTS